MLQHCRKNFHCNLIAYFRYLRAQFNEMESFRFLLNGFKEEDSPWLCQCEKIMLRDSKSHNNMGRVEPWIGWAKATKILFKSALLLILLPTLLSHSSTQLRFFLLFKNCTSYVFFVYSALFVEMGRLPDCYKALSTLRNMRKEFFKYCNFF